MARKKIPQGKPPGVDMLAFSSIMTIMLAFFIMLTSFIEDENAEMMQRASMSFKRAVSSFGLNSIIERIGGSDLLQLDIEKFRQNFPTKEIKNIHLNQDRENNIIEEDIDFESTEEPGESYIPTLVKFKFGNYKVSSEGKRLLDDFIDLVVDRPSKIIVEGRAEVSEAGRDGGYMDWYLSCYRAHSVAEYLSSKGRIDPKRISVVGYGKYRPLGDQVSGKGDGSFVSLIILSDK